MSARRGVGLVVAAGVTVACAAAPAAGPQPAAGAGPAPRVGDGEAWIVLQGAPQGLSLIRPDGTGNHVILGPPGEQLHPDWSPDGSRIAYVQADGTGSEIWITDPQGAAPAPLPADAPAEFEGLFWDNPSWSRDGSEIATVGYEGNPAEDLPARSVLVIVDVESGALSVAGELASADGALHSFPRWSPDGSALVVSMDRFDGNEFLGGAVAVVRRTDGGWSAPEPITEVVAGPRVDWHPTEELIVYGTNDVGGARESDEPSNLYTVRPDGSELTQITAYGPSEERATQPSWTPDGRILFTHVAGVADEQLTVAVVAADGSGLETVVDAGPVGVGNLPHPRLRPVS